MLIRKNDSGRSIVEMLGVLAIMGVITVMGISGYSQAIGKINRNKVTEEVSRITQEVRGLYAGKDNYTGLSDSILNGLGYTLENPYGGKYSLATVTPSAGGSITDRMFSVSMSNVTKSDCVYFYTMRWMEARDATGTETGTVVVPTSVDDCAEGGNILTINYM